MCLYSLALSLSLVNRCFLNQSWEVAWWEDERRASSCCDALALALLSHQWISLCEECPCFWRKNVLLIFAKFLSTKWYNNRKCLPLERHSIQIRFFCGFMNKQEPYMINIHTLHIRGCNHDQDEVSLFTPTIEVLSLSLSSYFTHVSINI